MENMNNNNIYLYLESGLRGPLQTLSLVRASGPHVLLPGEKVNQAGFADVSRSCIYNDKYNIIKFRWFCN